ncbi:MAG: efflux RND transporter permease subunit [Planctomycetota bacterium]
MNLPRLSVRRPVLTSMVTLIVVILGAVALERLQIDLLPDIDLPRLTVRTNYDGASPEVMERLVTQIVEEIVGTVPGAQEITSTSSEGSSRVRMTFDPSVDIDAAAIDVQVRLEDEANEFPDEVQRPSVRKFDIDSAPVVIVGISSKLDPVELTQLVENQIRYRFGRVPGVAQVDPWGGYDREVRVELDAEKIKAIGLPLNNITQAIRDANLDLPTGQIDRGRYNVTLRAPAEFENLDDLRELVVAVRGDATVRLGQIATVQDTYAELTRRVEVNGERGLRLAVRKEAQANTVEVSAGILAEIDALNRDFPQLFIVPVQNQGNFIERSIANVARSLLYGSGLAVIVLLFFLRNLRSTAVISLSIPISILATFAVVYLSGLTLNLMTLGGLALGVGMMVDSSIVVLENIYRRRQEENEPAKQAAVKGTAEVGGAIVASTITTLVIFLPLVFVRGVTGMLFTEFAYVVVISLVVALVVALTLVPMLASKLLGHAKTQATPAEEATTPRAGSAWRVVSRAAGRALGAVDDAYHSLLHTALRQRTVSLLLAAVLLGLSVLLVPFIGSEFLPASDEGQVNVRGDMEVATRLDLVYEQTQQMDRVVEAEVPEAVARITSASGNGSINLTLTPATQRDRSNQDIAEDLRQRLEGTVPGMNIRVRAPEGQNLLNRILPSGAGMHVEVRGFELETLEALADLVVEKIADVPGVTDVDAGQREGIPQERLAIDRARAADLGLSVRQIAGALETAVSGQLAGEYRAAGDSYPIRVQLRNARQSSLEDLLQLTLRTDDGRDVTLGSVVTTEPGRGPREIRRKDRQRTLDIEVNLGDRDMGSVARDIEDRLAEIPRPNGYDLRVAGSYLEQQESFRELLLSIVLALVLVYMVLASQYESLRDPLVVMLSVPMAAVGVLAMLFLTETTLNLQSYIGCIMLAGIVVNNAILLVDQAGHLRKDQGLSSRDAVAEAGRRRLRPILMTSATTMLGLLPLALGIGEGADAQAPLARAVIGGLLASMLITLVLVPVAYTLVHPDPRKLPTANKPPEVAS